MSGGWRWSNPYGIAPDERQELRQQRESWRATCQTHLLARDLQLSCPNRMMARLRPKSLVKSLLRASGAAGLILGGLYVVATLPCRAEAQSPPTAKARVVDRVTQISTFERLSRGGYDGSTRVYELAQSGNFGIGTLEGLDGELVILDGVTYHVPASGRVRKAAPQELVPFATVTRFRPEHRFESPTPLADYAMIQAFVTESMPDPAQILALKLHGTFSRLKLRAPQKQTKPYPTLTEALKTQAVFELGEIRGTLVGFRFPTYVGTVNAAGYHFHFLSDDRKTGGHVLEVASVRLTADVETVERYDVTLGGG